MDQAKTCLLAMRKTIDRPDSVYTSRNSSKGALLTESEMLFDYLAKNRSLDSARHAIVQDNFFAKRTYQTRKRCWEILLSRYFPQKGNRLDVHPIVTLFQTQASEIMKRGVLYYHFMISDLFSYEVTVHLVYSMFTQGLTNIAPRNVHEFLESRGELHPEIKRWSPQTRSSLVSHYLSAIRDFGILEGKVVKRIHRPIIEEDLLLYMVTYLRDCGKSPLAIIACEDFKLFLLSQKEVEARLAEAQLRGRIHFRKSGHIVSLEFPWRSNLEYIKNIRK